MGITGRQTRVTVGAMVLATASGCMPAVGPPVPPDSSLRLVMTDAPAGAALYESRGSVYVRHQGELPVLGPIVCPGVPCDARVVANQYLVATAPDIPPSDAVKIPAAADVRATVKAGARWKSDLVLPLGVVDAFALAGGILLVADTSTQASGSGQSPMTTTHPDLAFGVAALVGGAAGTVLTYMLWRDSKTRLSFITPDGVVHF